jgi:polyisoprenyl-phosphate glycosyltransferase
MTDKTKISVVIPVYNSEKIISELVDQLVNVFKTLNDYSLELILVNDGSSDSSWKVLTQENNKFPDIIKAINLSKNFGQHNALFCGFSFCTGDFVITMDDDLQHPPKEVVKLIDAQKESNADIVYGVYKVKHHSLIRNLGSHIIKTTSDTKKMTEGEGSSFRLVKKYLIETLIEKHSQHFLFIDPALTWYSTNISLVDVEHQPRKKGKTGYSVSKLLSLYFNIAYYYSAKPLKVLTGFGLFSSFISFLLGTWFIYKKLVYNVPLGYTSIIVAIMFSTSLVLLCLGVVGQYIHKLYQLQQNKPPYSIKKVL